MQVRLGSCLRTKLVALFLAMLLASPQAMADSVPLVNDGGTVSAPVLINNTLTLSFVIDTGASDVVIPADVVSTLIRTGTVAKTDFVGTASYILADGTKMPSAQFIIRELKIGNHVVRNVMSSVAPVNGALLLGQSFLSKLPPWSIDYPNNALTIRDAMGSDQAPSIPSFGSTWTDPTSGIEFVWVPGDTYQMGCVSWSGECYDSEKPLHTVTVAGFWLGRYLVTQGQYRRVMGSNPSHFQKGDTYPVEQVSWNDARNFVSTLNGLGNGTFRLPTEAEWEYACRSGGRQELYCGGNNADVVAWFYGNSASSTHPVGGKAANGLGLHDMSGNVSEWLEDCWHDNYSGAPTNGAAWITGNCSARVVRGGSWDSNLEQAGVRFREGNFGYYNIGFRVTRTMSSVTPTYQPVVLSPPIKVPTISSTTSPGTVFRDCPDCPEMVVIPAGSFMMGSPDNEAERTIFEGPRHNVRIGTSFAMGKYAVTRGEFSRFVADTGRTMAGKEPAGKIRTGR